MAQPPLLNRRFDPRALALLSADVAKYYKALPITLEGDRKLVAALSDPSKVDEIRALTNREVEAVIYPEEEILAAIESAYQLKPPEPLSNVMEGMESAALEPVLDRMDKALKRRASVFAHVYTLVVGDAELETILVDEFLAQGATAQARIYWSKDGIFEEHGGKLWRTAQPPTEHFEYCLDRMRVVAGLPKAGRGPAHARFEMDFGNWRFVVYAAFLDDGALLEFHPKSE